MYLQITNKCNMKCAHCCNSSGPRGKHMDMDLVRHAISFIAQYDDYIIAIGGGEPTLHPNFWEILGLCLGTFDDVWLATNGSQTEIAIKLAYMARKGILGVALSQDCYHNPIDERVIKAFKIDERHRGMDNDRREIRTVREISRTGRAKRTGNWTTEDQCVCPEIVIDEHGVIWACGCKTIKYGNVWRPDIPESTDDFNPFDAECRALERKPLWLTKSRSA